jgi:hypothetical protein
MPFLPGCLEQDIIQANGRTEGQIDRAELQCSGPGHGGIADDGWRIREDESTRV